MKECDQNNSIPVDQDLLSLSKHSDVSTSRTSEGLPLLNLSVLKKKKNKKNDQHRPRKRDRYANIKPEVLHVSNAGKSDDNQKTHLSCKHHIAHDAAEDQTTANRSACEVVTEESLLPHIVLKSAVSSPQKLSPPRLRKIYTRRTWNVKPQRVANDFRSGYNTSSSDDTLLTFKATETILLAEIDANERCASFLRQRGPQGTLLSHPDRDNSSLSQIQYKLRALDRKIKMNKEKLAQVRERITELGGESSCFTVASAQEESEKTAYGGKKSGHDENKYQDPRLADANQQKPKLKKFSSIAAMAVVIQSAFRAFRARCHLSDLLSKTYQRVLHPGSNQYFYYNRITRLSQWETPLLLRHCHYSLDANLEFTSKLANSTTNIDSALTVNAAAKVIQTMFRQRALRVFMQDLKLGNLEKVFDAGFGAWYYFNARTNRSFWENVHHVRLTATNSAIYHRHQSSE